ncbi:MAG: SOS response-associated peptidase [Anaerolineae bacterium]|nr:SOS response-associated peptidase [Anaerolineae bacterium]
MCGRFTLTTPDQDLAVQFNLPEIPDLKPRYNIAPTQPVAVVRLPAEGSSRELALVHWGLIPFWADDPKIGARMINARAETAADKPAFRAAFRRRRCLVPADGFYEWQKQNGPKQPYYIHMADGTPFAFAGLWERWQGPDDTVIDSCTLLTTEPNDLIRSLHNRMPVILQPQHYDLWLDPSLEDASVLKPLLRPYASGVMDAYPVSRWVNKPENEGPACIEPLLGLEP